MIVLIFIDLNNNHVSRVHELFWISFPFYLILFVLLRSCSYSTVFLISYLNFKANLFCSQVYLPSIAVLQLDFFSSREQLSANKMKRMGMNRSLNKCTLISKFCFLKPLKPLKSKLQLGFNPACGF